MSPRKALRLLTLSGLLLFLPVIVEPSHLADVVKAARANVMPAEVAATIEQIEHEYGPDASTGVGMCQEAGAFDLRVCAVGLNPTGTVIGQAHFREGKLVAVKMRRANDAIYLWDPIGTFKEEAL